MKAFYNDINYECCALLSNLMDAGLITKGVICDKSIDEIIPKTLMQFDRVHMFAGVGGWELALNIAGWGDRQIWTGSCPCQPFSQAGKGAGTADERHLWPDWMHLIRQCKPPVLFGEQVGAAIRVGWLDTVFDDLQNSGYACGAANLPACSVGAPHLRERVWFVGSLADDSAIGRQDGNRAARNAGRRAGSRPEALRRGDASRLALTNSERGNGRGNIGQTGWAESADGCDLGNQSVIGNDGTQFATIERTSDDASPLGNSANWDVVEWLACIDDKSRPTEPGLSPLAHGIPRGVGPLIAELERMGCSPADAKRISRDGAKLLRAASSFRTSQIKGYGNAIVPQVAAEFIRSVM